MNSSQKILRLDSCSCFCLQNSKKLSIHGFKCLKCKTHLSVKFVNFTPKVFIKESIENRIDDWNWFHWGVGDQLNLRFLTCTAHGYDVTEGVDNVEISDFNISKYITIKNRKVAICKMVSLEDAAILEKYPVRDEIEKV